LDVTLVGGSQAFENLDCGGLAGAVRAEHSETLSAADLEVQAGDGHRVAVALDQSSAP
jgi:hypothetical protein